MSDLLTFVVLGLATGSIYGLAGTGLVLTYSTSGVFNFAHGAVAALGAYAFYELVDRHGLPWPLALALCLGVGGVVMGLMLEALTRRLQDVELHFQVAATVGLVLVAQDLMTTRFGYEAHFVKDFLPTRTFVVLGARVGVNQLLLLAVGAGAAMGVQAMLRSTRQGIAVRAVVDNPALLGQTGTAPAASRPTSQTSLPVRASKATLATRRARTALPVHRERTAQAAARPWPIPEAPQ